MTSPTQAAAPSFDRAPLLVAHGLKKSYGRQPLFEIDSLALHAGDACLLTGRNGAGKSTLMRVLAGLEPADRGEFHYRGARLSRYRHKRLGGRVIYLHQQPCLFDTTVEKNLAFGLGHLQRDEVRQRVAQALEWSGLSYLWGRNARTLSGGEKQRIALARAWVMAPELLLLDEPTANMDSEAREQTLFLVRRLINEGMSILLCCHDLRGDHRLIRRHLHLKDGALREETLTRTIREGAVADPAPGHPLSLMTEA